MYAFRAHLTRAALFCFKFDAPIDLLIIPLLPVSFTRDKGPPTAALNDFAFLVNASIY